jgi:predicted metalloendopeptidase
MYNRSDIGGVKALTPKIDWDAYFKALGHSEVTQINVATPDFFKGLEKV